MTIDFLIDYCLSKPGVTESFPFDQSTLVFKVGNKMFALVNIDKFEFINLKCPPEKSIELRAQYPDDILPGYHMNKKHWNSVVLNGLLTDRQICQLIDVSYHVIFDKLPKSIQAQINKL